MEESRAQVVVHRKNERAFRCTCGKRLEFAKGGREISCTCGRRHARITSFDREKLKRATGLAFGALVFSPLVSSTVTVWGGENGIYGVQRCLKFRCNDCTVVVEESELTKHHEEHTRRLARTA